MWAMFFALTTPILALTEAATCMLQRKGCILLVISVQFKSIHDGMDGVHVAS